jgi:hypothetical protein
VSAAGGCGRAPLLLCVAAPAAVNAAVIAPASAQRQAQRKASESSGNGRKRDAGAALRTDVQPGRSVARGSATGAQRAPESDRAQDNPENTRVLRELPLVSVRCRRPAQAADDEQEWSRGELNPRTGPPVPPALLDALARWMQVVDRLTDGGRDRRGDSAPPRLALD